MIREAILDFIKFLIEGRLYRLHKKLWLHDLEHPHTDSEKYLNSDDVIATPSNKKPQ